MKVVFTLVKNFTKYFQLLKGAKSLKTDKSFEETTTKVTQLESELKEALAKIKELETAKDEKSEKKVRFSSEVSKNQTENLKLKQDELDKLKLSYNKVSKIILTNNIKIQIYNTKLKLCVFFNL